MAENENKNIILTDMEVTETNEPIQIDETIQVIEFDDVNTYEIQTDNAFAALGEPNEQLRHSLLANREDPNQHPIIAIEGLRQELDSIEALQTVYSDKKQQADYYMWHDENLAGDNRVGYFVSMHKATEHDTLHGTLCCIEMCDGTQDIFGVTVSEAGFIGGQEYAQATDGTKVGRNHKYGLVVHSGLVGVQCESDVAVGDYVAPNSRGIAAKTNGKYGYLVTTMSDINGIMHAIISLTPSSVIAQTVADNLDNLGERMTSAEYNITSVTNVANSAYSLAIDAKENAEVNSEYLEEKITEVLGRMDAVDSVVGTLGESVNNASAEAAMARTIADGAVSSAEAIKDEAVKSANEANQNVNDLIKKYQPLDEWVDPTTGQISKSYIIDDLDNNGLATKSEIRTVEDQTEKNYTAIQQNAKSLQSLASKIDKYAMGEYSQAYGLTLEQAKSILENGCVYVPTVVHSETYSDYTQEFSLGYYYTWNGEGWLPSQSTAVSFSSEYFVGTEATPYWGVTIDDVVKDGVTYDLGGLYHWENDGWVKVASVADNVLSRAISVIKVTTNSIETSVAAIDNKYAGTKTWVDNNKTAIQDTVKWHSDNGDSLVTFMQEAGNNFASASQVAQIVDKDGNVNAASIVTAVNESDSAVAINADKIVMTGTTTFLKPGDLGEGGNTTIDGARIQTGTISADRLDLSGVLTVSAKSDLVSDVEVLYARSSSSTEFIATTEWSTSAPEWVDGEYMWQKTITTYADHTDVRPHQTATTTCIHGAKGESGTSPYLVRIDSTNGNIFRNGEIETILTAVVFYGDKDITNDIIPGRFLWTRVSTDTQGDVLWNDQKSKNRSKQITITSDDVRYRATFFCTIQDE